MAPMLPFRWMSTPTIASVRCVRDVKIKGWGSTYMGPLFGLEMIMAGVTTFLKKLGGMLVRIENVAESLWPFLKGLFGSGKAASVANTVYNDFEAIANLAVAIEAAYPGDGTGAQKLQALVPLVANVIKTSNLISGKQVANNDLFIKGCTEVAQGVVDVLNSIHADEAKHANA